MKTIIAVVLMTPFTLLFLSMLWTVFKDKEWRQALYLFLVLLAVIGFFVAFFLGLSLLS